MGDDRGDQGGPFGQARRDHLLVDGVGALPTGPSHRASGRPASRSDWCRRHLTPPHRRPPDRQNDRPSATFASSSSTASRRLPGRPIRHHGHLQYGVTSAPAADLSRQSSTARSVSGSTNRNPISADACPGTTFVRPPPVIVPTLHSTSSYVRDQCANGDQLVDEFVDRGDAAAGVEGGVRLAAGDLDPDPAAAAAGRLQVAVRMRRLQAERGDHAGRLGGDELTRGGGTDLLVSDDDDPHRTVIDGRRPARGPSPGRPGRPSCRRRPARGSRRPARATASRPAVDRSARPCRGGQGRAAVPPRRVDRGRGSRRRRGHRSAPARVGRCRRARRTGDEAVGERVQRVHRTGRGLVLDVLPQPIDHPHG